jgi:hypothetical protein
VLIAVLVVLVVVVAATQMMLAQALAVCHLGRGM